MRIPEFQITDEKTKAALMGFLSLLTKDQSRAIATSLAEVGEALEKGDMVAARTRANAAASGMIAIVKAIDESADLLGVEYPLTAKGTLEKASGLMHKSAAYY